MNRMHPLDKAFALVGLVLAAAGATAHAQAPAPTTAGDPVVYPSRGQDAKQQDLDRYQCHDWARGQSGFDPSRATAQAPAPAAATPTPSTTDPTGGMAKGAIGGAAVGELAHRDVGRSAATGALASGLLTKVKAQQQAKQAAAAAVPPPSTRPTPQQPQRATYDRAFGACLEGRGYTVR